MTATNVSSAGEPRLRYVVRPILLRGCTARGEELDPCATLGSGSGLQIPGFGVEMAVKNMEYSALDDKKVDSSLSQHGLYFRFKDRHDLHTH